MAIGERRECGWDELFATIWENAVQNDRNEAVQKLTDEDIIELCNLKK